MIDPAWLALLGTIGGGVGLKSIEMYINRSGATQAVSGMTEDEFDDFMDNWIPGYLFFPDMRERLDKITTNKELTEFDPFDYQGVKAKQVELEKSRMRKPISSRNSVFSGVFLSMDYEDDVEPPKYKRTANPQKVQETYLYSNYVDIESDLIGHISTKPTGKRIAKLVDYKYDPVDGLEKSYWVCVNHDDINMTIKHVDSLNPDHYPGIAGQFECPKCKIGLGKGVTKINGKEVEIRRRPTMIEPKPAKVDVVYK